MESPEEHGPESQSDGGQDQNAPFVWLLKAKKAQTPTYFQSNPPNSLDSLYPNPTFNQSSRRKWAAKHVRRLEHFHDTHCPPTHVVTIKFNQPVSVEVIKQYRMKLRHAISYHNRTTQNHIAGIYAIEIEKNNCVHEHHLVRATNDPTHFLERTIEKISAKLGVDISLDYCEPANNPDASVMYMFKLVNGKAPLLFGRHLGLRHTGKYGNYYFGETTRKLDRNATDDFILGIQEKQVDEIVGVQQESDSHPPLPNAEEREQGS